MLILTRSCDESIVIGEAVKVTVLGMKGGQVRLGIDAPDSVKILRGELVDRSKHGNGHAEGDSAESRRPGRQSIPRTS